MAVSRMRNRDKLSRKLIRLPQEMKAEIGKAIEEGARDVVAMAKRLAPVESGELRDSITFTMGQERIKYSQGVGGVRGDPDLSARISAGNSDVRYAHLVEFNTAPHNIYPGANSRSKKQQALAFAGVVVPYVHHPGTKAQPFFWPAWRANVKRARLKINKAVRKAAREVARK